MALVVALLVVASACSSGDDSAGDSAERDAVPGDGLGGEEHRVPRGEHRIFARDHPGREPAFVLMHGFPDNSHLYDRLVPELSGHRVIVFDYLGWGRSDKPQDHDYTFANQQDDLDAVIRYFDLHQVHLVAHDAAGPSAVNWALDHPTETASLTLMNAFYHPTETLRPPGLIALFIAGHAADVLGSQLPVNLTALAEEVADQPETFQRLLEWQEQQFFARPEDAEHFIPLFAAQFDGDDSSRRPLLSLTADAINAVVTGAQRLGELAAFPAPVRLIWGDKDPDLNSDIARVLHEAIPSSELFILPDAHHNLQIDEPARVAELLEEL
jgi:haloalkane dehalogenase